MPGWCETCKHYSRENIHEGYCNIKGTSVMKDDNCNDWRGRE